MIEEKKEEIEFYIQQVEDLYSSIQKWLEKKYFHFKRKPIILHEEKTGKYTVEKLLICKDKNVIAELKPVGLDIIGASGRVDLATQYESRKFLYFKNGGPVITTKIEGHKKEHKIFRGIEEDGWYWVESITLKKAYKVNQEVFLNILDEVTSRWVI
ncbi:MAG TPA: hypothetical protein VJ895_00960 [Candidatus Nanoarchaeia archaeon]|nr:hypothetical protein [Candidatus Nanoarchaeia archaeon]